MREAARDEVLRRLRSVEGHVRGVAKMVEGGDATYAEVVQQTSAIFAALRRVNAVVVRDYVEERAGEAGVSEDAIRDLVGAMERVAR